MKHFALGWACNLNDILVRFPYDKYKSLKPYNKLEKRNIIKRIINCGVKIMLDDIIENNNTFKLQGVNKQRAEIHFEPITGSDFERVRKKGKFSKIDFLESLFTGYQLYMYIKGDKQDFNYRKKKPIYFGKHFRDKLIEKTNEGKTYG